MANRKRGSGWMLLLVCALGCSAHRRAGTGDVAFRLVWDGESDLDLVVQDPAGACIFFATREVASGGQLDIDCNAGTGRVCRYPLENVFWPRGAAPPGDYVFWVEAHALIPAEAPLAAELQLLRGERVVWRRSASFVTHQQVEGPFRYRYPEGGEPESAAGGFAERCSFQDPSRPRAPAPPGR